MPDAKTTDLDADRKRLRYRAWHRGILEMDLLLGGFADAYLDSFDGGQLHRFELLLNQPDPEIYAWYCRRRPTPEHQANDVVNLFLKFKLSA